MTTNKAQHLYIEHEALGEAMIINLISEEKRAFAILTINGVHYHLERLTQRELATDYKVDQDPDYLPRVYEVFCGWVSNVGL